MEIVDKMPGSSAAGKQDWDSAAEHVKSGAVVKFTAPDDYDADKAQAFRSTLYTRFGQRGVRINASVRPDGVYVAAKAD